MQCLLTNYTKLRKGLKAMDALESSPTTKAGPPRKTPPNLKYMSFDPDTPKYDISKVLKLFDKYSLPRPVPPRIIPKRARNHPKYSPRPPFDSYHLLPYMAGMINQVVQCIYMAKPKLVELLEDQFTSASLIFYEWLLQALWSLMIPGTLVFSLPAAVQMSGDDIEFLKVGSPSFNPFGSDDARTVSVLLDKGLPIVYSIKLPVRTYIVTSKGRQLLEYFYSQKLWDFVSEKGDPDVEILVIEVLQEILHTSGLLDGSRAQRVPKVPAEIERDTAKLIQRESKQYASEISSRFESPAVRDAVRAQSFGAFDDWMLPGLHMDFSYLQTTSQLPSHLRLQQASMNSNP